MALGFPTAWACRSVPWPAGAEERAGAGWQEAEGARSLSWCQACTVMRAVALDSLAGFPTCEGGPLGKGAF